MPKGPQTVPYLDNNQAVRHLSSPIKISHLELLKDFLYGISPMYSATRLCIYIHIVKRSHNTRTT
ncbi:hypothetical protein Hanom_Chr08g00696771 [Helianthus anomalus]